MPKSLFLASVLAAIVLAPGFAQAEEAPRPTAVELCRTEVAARAGVPVEQVRLDQIRARARTVRVDLDLWRDGRLQNIRCDVARNADAFTIAAIDPALSAVAANDSAAAR
ncbi:MAG: hypothetical protein R3C16_06380 [Hyphomonadaceae bacterium]